MRLSVTLDPDLHQIAAARARARRTSISREINDLIRQAIAAPIVTAAHQGGVEDAAAHICDPKTGLLISEGRRRFPVSPGRSPVSEEDIRRGEEDDDRRHWNV